MSHEKRGGAALLENPVQQAPDQQVSQEEDRQLKETYVDPEATIDVVPPIFKDQESAANMAETIAVEKPTFEGELVTGRWLVQMRKIRDHRNGEFKMTEMEVMDIITNNSKAKNFYERAMQLSEAVASPFARSEEVSALEDHLTYLRKRKRGEDQGPDKDQYDMSPSQRESLRKIVVERNIWNWIQRGFESKKEDRPLNPEESAQILSQSIAENYTLIRRIGKGGFGSVFSTAEGDVVKIINTGILNEARVAAMIKETELMSQIDHPNVVPFKKGEVVMEYLTKEEIKKGHRERVNFWYSMPKIEGQDLEEVLAEKGKLSEKDSLNIALQAAQGLKAAHDVGIIHRDVKPANIMLAQENGKQVVKVADFGLAIMEGGQQVDGSISGSPLYASPEQLGGVEKLTPKSDVYGLGASLYELVAGKAAFFDKSHNLITIITAVRETDLIPPKEVAPETSDELSNLIVKMMEKDPKKRISMAEAIKELSVLLRGETLPELVAKQKETLASLTDEEKQERAQAAKTKIQISDDRRIKKRIAQEQASQQAAKSPQTQFEVKTAEPVKKSIFARAIALPGKIKSFFSRG